MAAPYPYVHLDRAMKKLLLALMLVLPAAAADGLQWTGWSDDLFDRAKREKRFVLLDLEAVWCHWCHVMDETTYKDPATIRLLESKYITVRVDQDSRPDLANRYEDYGWPATVVYAPDGRELVKRQGYIPPKEMASMLRAVIADPTPGPSVRAEEKVEFPANAVLPAKLRAQLEATYLRRYDARNGAWGFEQKFLDWDSVEYAMALARKGDAKAERMARQTLDAQLNLLDPAWGGVYQYSTDGDWKHPHFEKIMQFQAENLRIYALAYLQYHEPRYLKAAMEIRRFLKTFLMSPEGAFYTSQNADLVDGEHSAEYFRLDDAGRRKLGIPRVDQHVYARENGWAIQAFAALYQATGDAEVLAEARRAAAWVMANRAIEGSGFRHGERDAAGPYLGDTLAMSRAMLALYASTGERVWLERSEAELRFIAGNFRNTAGAGYVTVSSAGAKPERDENAMLARVANLVWHYTGDGSFRKMAEEAMRYVVAPQVARTHSAAGALLPDLEMNTEPVHLTIVGHKDEPAAIELFRTAVRYPSGYKRIEWWDVREGRLPNPDVEYPELKKPAAFVCTAKSCSPPVFAADQLLAKADRLAR